MSIKPVDYQVMIPKAAEVSKISNEGTQKNQAMHQQQTTAMQNKVDNNLKQVYSQEKAQEAKIKEKQEGKKEGKNKKKDKEDKTNKKKLINGIETSTIDIKI